MGSITVSGNTCGMRLGCIEMTQTSLVLSYLTDLGRHDGLPTVITKMSEARYSPGQMKTRLWLLFDMQLSWAQIFPLKIL